MITVLCWRWAPPQGYRSTFGPETVHALDRMVKRHYPKQHRFVCVTDDPTGLDGIETFPLWSDHALVPSPHGGKNPSCYRRLKAFAPEAGQWFGERIVSIDLDTVIVGDLSPLFDRQEDFIIWGQSDFPKSQWFNGSLWMLKTGSRPQVWQRFNPATSPQEAKAAGARGSDQGWLSYILGHTEATWTDQDGVYSYRVHLKRGALPLPKNAKVICFHGQEDPWHPQPQRLPWVRKHWGEAAA